ncbi:MAG: D-alanine--D-alanine ligase [Gammaproteobacteria bacterium]
MKQKIRIGLLYGGKSAEHDVSILSAKNIAKELDPETYEVMLIQVDQHGRWSLQSKINTRLDSTSASSIVNPSASNTDTENGPCTRLLFSPGVLPGEPTRTLIPMDATQTLPDLDVIFPIIHGSYGEDGSIQGLLKLLNIPFVGASVLGSAVGMDKDVMKRLLRDAGIRHARFKCFTQNEKMTISYDTVQRELGSPLFIKPANLGSSIGISKVNNEAAFLNGVELAFQYDRKIIIEEYVQGRELECALIGNEMVEASIPGEVVKTNETHDFYSYDAKYLDKESMTVHIPARITEAEATRIQETAIAAYKALCCEGMARVDVFLMENGEVLVNEINTLPGFTDISMYPQLWAASGKNYQALLKQLIELALDRNKQEQQLLTTL